MAAEHVERIGARIRERRDELGLSRDEVARRMPGNTNGNAVYRWERGKHEPRSDTLEALAEVLDVPVAYFYADAPDKSKGTPDLGDILMSPTEPPQWAQEIRAAQEELRAWQDEILERQDIIISLLQTLGAELPDEAAPSTGRAAA